MSRGRYRCFERNAYGAVVMLVAMLFSTAGLDAELCRISLDKQWRFDRFGPMPDGTQRAEPSGLEASAYNDTGWRELDLPHDWGVEGPFRAEIPGNTGKLPWAGIGWYRKALLIKSEDAGKRMYLDIHESSYTLLA